MSTVLPLIIIVVAALLAFAVGAMVASRKGFKRDGEVVARCRQGHLFTTVWVGRFSWRQLDLGFAKIQRCPVDGRLTVVRPADVSALTPEQKRAAKRVRDDAPHPKE
jgi:hypothetical protein